MIGRIPENRIKIMIGIAFFLIALTGFLPLVQIEGQNVGLSQLLGGLVDEDIAEILTYLKAFHGALADLVRTWIACGVLAVIIPIICGVLALLLKGRWVLLSSGLGIFADCIVRGILASDINNINELVEEFGFEELIAFVTWTLVIWVILHVIVAGLILWWLLGDRREENRQVRFNDADKIIDETVVQRAPAGYNEWQVMPEAVAPEQRQPAATPDEPEPVVKEHNSTDEVIDEKGAEEKMEKKMRKRELTPDEEARRDELFQRLGEEYYELAKEEPLPDLLPLIDEITELTMEPEPDPVMEMEKTIIWDPPVKEPVGAAVDEESASEEAEAEAPAEEAEEAQVEEAEAAPAEEASHDTGTGILEDQILSPEEASMRTCPECGIYLPEGAKFCEECGYRVVEAPKVEEKPRPMFCPNCGNLLREGARFCGKCGTKIG